MTKTPKTSGPTPSRDSWANSFKPPPPLAIVRDVPPPLPQPAIVESEPAEVAQAPVGRSTMGSFNEAAQDRAYAQPDPRPRTLDVSSPVGWERTQADALLEAFAALRVDLVLVGIRHDQGGSLAVLRTGPAQAQVINLMPTVLVSLGWSPDVPVNPVGDTAVEVRLPAPLVDKRAPSSCWVPVAVREAVREKATLMGESHNGFFLGAFNRQYPNLQSLFPNRVGSPGPM